MNKIENYVKIKTIGKGNYGKATLCKSILDNELYVLKSIKISKMTEEQISSAQMEVELLKNLKHPYIIRYISSIYTSKSIVIVTEYAECGDIGRIVKIQKNLNTHLRIEVVMNWFVQICFAVKYLHDRKVLHRDLKLSNIFVNSKGEIKLGDFGISKLLDSTSELADTIIGTPYYLSPEICNKESYSYKSDIWSLGCLIYELLTNHHPFEGSNLKELCYKILNTDYKSILYYRKLESDKKVIQDLENSLACLLSKNQLERLEIDEVLEMKIMLKYIKINLLRQLSTSDENENEHEQNIKTEESSIKDGSILTVIENKSNEKEKEKEKVTKKSKIILNYDEVPLESKRFDNTNISNYNHNQEKVKDKVNYLKKKVADEIGEGNMIELVCMMKKLYKKEVKTRSFSQEERLNDKESTSDSVLKCLFSLEKSKIEKILTACRCIVIDE